MIPGIAKLDDSQLARLRLGPATAPTVESTDPADNAIDVPVDATIEIVFSMSMHSDSINSDNITISPAVEATVSLAADSKTASINPTGDLANDTEYTVTVGTGVLGLYGWAKVPLAEAYELTFTTAA